MMNKRSPTGCKVNFHFSVMIGRGKSLLKNTVRIEFVDFKNYFNFEKSYEFWGKKQI
jgi:hypothetical protein